MSRYALVLSWSLFNATLIFAQMDAPTSRLLSTCQSNNLTAVQESLAQGADVNAKDQAGYTPLLYAVTAGNLQMTELLLEKGAHQDVNDSQGRCPVIIAVQTGNVQLLQKLAGAGGDLGHRHVITRGDARTPLHIAVQNQDIPMVKYLLSQKVSMEARNIDFESPLMLAAMTGNLEMVKLLVENGANMYATRGFGSSLLESEMYPPPPPIKRYLQEVEQKRLSALEEPVWAGVLKRDEIGRIKPESIEEYLQQGGDPHGKDKEGQTLLHYAAGAGAKKDLLESLLTVPEIDINTADIHGMTPLHIACRYDELENVKTLLEYGAAVDARDRNEKTPLIILAQYYHSGISGDEQEVQIARMLLENGAEVNAADAFGKTPLLCLSEANMDKHLAFTRLLIEHGADVNRQDCAGKTFLHGASEMGTAAMMKLAIEAGADLNMRNYYGRSILNVARYDKQEKIDLFYQYKKGVSVLEAVYYSQTDILDSLIQQGANINMTTDYDNAATGLIIAAKRNDLKMTKKLLELGVTIDDRDNLGSTALHYAAQYGFDNIVTQLLDNGADVTLRNKEGWRALDLAGTNDRYRAIQLFKDRYPDMQISTQPVLEQQTLNLAVSMKNTDREMTEGMTISVLSKLVQEVNPNVLHAAVPDANMIQAQLQKEEHKQQVRAYLTQTSKPLHKAVIQDNQQMVKRLLAAGSDIHEIDEAGMLPLTYAVLLDDQEMATLLLENGADINRLDTNVNFWEQLGIWGWGHTVGQEGGWAALHYITATGSEQMLQFLLQHGADVDIKEKEHGNSPIFMAVQVDRPDMLKILIEAGADLTLNNKIGRTLLHSLAARGKIDYIKLLLENGADIDVGKPGTTPLMTAADLGEDDTMIFLLENGADINILNINAPKLSRSMLSKPYATETLKILTEYGFDINTKPASAEPLLFSLFNTGAKMKNGLRENVQLLLDAGMDVNATDKEGNTVLHFAAKKCYMDPAGSVELVGMLIPYGADVNRTNAKGQTPLDIMLNPYVRSCGSKELIRLLAENNTHLNDTDRYGCNSLHNAVVLGWADIVILLASKGADIENRTNDMQGQKTPLHSAIYEKHADVVKALLDAGANIEARDKNERTPLMTAVASEKMELIQILLEYQPDCNTQDKYDNTCLHLAVEKGNKEIIRLLLKAEARTDIPNRNQMTPKALAERFNKTEIAALFP